MNTSIFDRKKKRKEARAQKKLQKDKYYKRFSQSSQGDNLINIQENSHQKEDEEENNDPKLLNIKKKPIAKKISAKENKQNSEKLAKKTKKTKKEIKQLPSNEDDELINYYSKKLGMKEEKGLKKFHKEIIHKDGLDEDLFSFLDKIDQDVLKNLDDYQPREKSLIDEEEDYQEDIDSNNQEENEKFMDDDLNEEFENNEEIDMDIEEDQDIENDNNKNKNDDNLDEEIDSDEVELDYEPKIKIISTKSKKEKKMQIGKLNEEKFKIQKSKKKEENPNIGSEPKENLIIENKKRNPTDLYGFGSKNNNDKIAEKKPMTFTEMLAARKSNIIKDNTQDEIIKTIQSNLNKLSEGNIDNIFQKFVNYFFLNV